MEGKLAGEKISMFTQVLNTQIYFSFLLNTTSQSLLVLTAKFVNSKCGVVPRICISNSFLGNAAAH